MADLFSSGSTWLETMRQGHLVRSVLYESITVNATRAKTLVRGIDAYGRVVSVVSQDFHIASTEIAEPKKGDRIIDDGKTYEVMPMTDSGRCWEWADYNKLVYKIYTKEII